MDRSKQGFIDEDIQDLIHLLNSKGYETSSSCSGRIVLLKIPKIGDKPNAEWVYKTHKKADFKHIFEVLKKENRVYFLQEPPIIHVNCKSLEHAGKLLKLARQTGFKHSGIISLEKFTVEVRGNERIEVPIKKLGMDFVRILVEEANKKLDRGKKKLKRFERLIKSEFYANSS